MVIRRFTPHLKTIKLFLLNVGMKMVISYVVISFQNLLMDGTKTDKLHIMLKLTRMNQ